jgi:uncharacterized protein YacL
MTIILIRIVIVLASIWAAVLLSPTLELPESASGVAGGVLGLLAVWLEYRAGSVAVERLFWGATGGFFGLIAGLAIGMALSSFFPAAGLAAVGLPALLATYLGAAIAVRRHQDLEGVSSILFPTPPRHPPLPKIVDTSVIIDGRIADVCEAGFVEGTLVVPQFVLQELQQIADASDPLKRSRGKRGFDVLQRLRRMTKVKVDITDLDFPHVTEVDRKLIELAKALGGKVLTNDYNLTKLAELSGMPVLNLNELANGLKPAALPGETMRVHVLREGKEAGQGVAYLDDGTMVVVEHGKRHLGQTVDVSVTSVLQTSAGRMIFSRLKDDEGGGRGA